MNIKSLSVISVEIWSKGDVKMGLRILRIAYTYLMFLMITMVLLVKKCYYILVICEYLTNVQHLKMYVFSPTKRCSSFYGRGVSCLLNNIDTANDKAALDEVVSLAMLITRLSLGRFSGKKDSYLGACV